MGTWHCIGCHVATASASRDMISELYCPGGHASCQSGAVSQARVSLIQLIQRAPRDTGCTRSHRWAVSGSPERDVFGVTRRWRALIPAHPLELPASQITSLS